MPIISQTNCPQNDCKYGVLQLNTANMPAKESTVLCKTPTPGKKGTRIAEWKYDCIKRAILKAIPKNRTGIAFKELLKRVEKSLTTEQRNTLGSTTWYTVTVKLDMEVRGELERIADVSPQRIRRV